MNKHCARAEMLAGAIALGEASDREREEYRRHITACESCLRDLGGERGIERVMETVSLARESEVWEPVPVRATERRARRTRLAWTFGASTAVVAAIASLGIHAMVAVNARPIVVAAAPRAQAPAAFHVTIEHRVAPPAALPKPKPAPPVAAQPQPAQPRIVVVHNVITLKQSDRPEAKPTAKPEASNVPIWRRNRELPRTAIPAEATIARTEVAPVLGGHAESIAVAPSYSVVRDVTPIGGDTAINPRPAPIAYAMGAEGTTAFEVTVDERGLPVKCTITKPSGYLVLDNAVCKAAMQARYSPRTVNGRPTVGLYRDAFTFRASNSSDGI